MIETRSIRQKRIIPKTPLISRSGGLSLPRDFEFRALSPGLGLDEKEQQMLVGESPTSQIDHSKIQTRRHWSDTPLAKQRPTLPLEENPEREMPTLSANEVPSVSLEAASPFSRVGAFLLDGFLLGGVSLTLLLFGISVGGGGFFLKALREFMEASLWTQAKVGALGLGIFGGIYFLYFLATEWIVGRSLGKWFFKLRVISRESLPRRRISLFQSLMRQMFLIFSSLPFGIGLLWGLASEDHEMLHDLFSRTQVIHDR